MSRRDYRLYLNDIRDCCAKIKDYTKGIGFEEFLHNPMLADAVVRNLGIIGEATKWLTGRRSPGFGISSSTSTLD